MPDKRANSGQVLVLNCGSSSLKFALIDPRNGDASLGGLGDALGHSAPTVSWNIGGEKHSAPLKEGAKHTEVIEFVVNHILSGQGTLLQAISAIGHRVVHGGEKFSHSVRINDQVIRAIQDCVALAPLHNPAHLQGIEAATKAFPGLPQVAVFDTAFHQTMPRQAYIYALPYELYTEHGIRRYGMHGTSHRFVSERAAAILGKASTDVNIISAHLGNGASIAAIQAGKSVDTSMGLTPLEGLVMGTRCGDIDPGLLLHLGVRLDYCLKEINDLLNKKSGLLGISQLSNDCRALEQAASEGHQGAQLALEIFCYRLAKYIASYHGVLSKVDALVFTGGIGENSAFIRENVVSRLGGLGYQTNQARNLEKRFGAEGHIESATNGAPSPTILVIPTNEEWVIARDAAQIIEGDNSTPSAQSTGGG
ncbi:acetate kinase [Microbulbifer agarilyticus]|uniref:Acetate kinase n=1 Tax=Microbulbifer agarilyticus TaxID=260552 RepID=A0A1Q2M4Y6_9GAMM|nr:acetate kinase [Microbulbifer agarilyticus]AQQ67710.1 acetate kinase [Microbulbifer agarilyticus]